MAAVEDRELSERRRQIMAALKKVYDSIASEEAPAQLRELVEKLK